MKCIICLSPFESDEAFIPELDCSCTFITHHECWEEWEKIGDCLYCRPKYIIQEMPPQNNIAVHKIIIFVFCNMFGYLYYHPDVFICSY